MTKTEVYYRVFLIPTLNINFQISIPTCFESACSAAKCLDFCRNNLSLDGKIIKVVRDEIEYVNE